MSTKIYNGFQTSFGDLETFLDLVHTFRDGYWKKGAIELREKFVAAAFAGFPVQDAEAKRKAYSLWWDLSSKARTSTTRQPALDTDFKVTIFPDSGRFIGIAYTEHDKWFEAWLKLPGIREYGYWNNVDPPDHVTDEEWEARREVWDRVLPGCGIPAMEGFSIDVSDTFGAPIATLEEMGL